MSNGEQAALLYFVAAILVRLEARQSANEGRGISAAVAYLVSLMLAFRFAYFAWMAVFQ